MTILITSRLHRGCIVVIFITGIFTLSGGDFWLPEGNSRWPWFMFKDLQQKDRWTKFANTPSVLNLRVLWIEPMQHIGFTASAFMSAICIVLSGLRLQYRYDTTSYCGPSLHRRILKQRVDILCYCWVVCLFGWCKKLNFARTRRHSDVKEFFAWCTRDVLHIYIGLTSKNTIIVPGYTNCWIGWIEFDADSAH